MLFSPSFRTILFFEQHGFFVFRACKTIVQDYFFCWKEGYWPTTDRHLRKVRGLSKANQGFFSCIFWPSLLNEQYVYQSVFWSFWTNTMLIFLIFNIPRDRHANTYKRAFSQRNARKKFILIFHSCTLICLSKPVRSSLN